MLQDCDLVITYFFPFDALNWYHNQKDAMHNNTAYIFVMGIYCKAYNVTVLKQREILTKCEWGSAQYSPKGQK